MASAAARLARGRRVSAFTVAEILIGIVILTILVSMATLGYQGYRDRAAMLVDETNQKILQAAVKLYAYDNNALPASLSELRPGDVQRAYALVTNGKERYTLLAHLKEFVRGGVAHAQVLGARYYNNDAKVLDCLSDPTPHSRGGVSYALAEGWAGAPLSRFQEPTYMDDLLIVESDVRNPSGSANLAYRHGLFLRRASVGMTASGEPILTYRGGGIQALHGTGAFRSGESDSDDDRAEGRGPNRGKGRGLLHRLLRLIGIRSDD